LAGLFAGVEFFGLFAPLDEEHAIRRRGMKKNLLVVLALAGLFALAFMAAQTLATPADAGKDLFVSSKCNMCHAVSSAGIEAKMKNPKMQGRDLTGITATRDAAWITKYIKKEEKIEGKAHKATFKGTDEDIQALIDWLGTQK